jgi:hypothetical protein
VFVIEAAKVMRLRRWIQNQVQNDEGEAYLYAAEILIKNKSRKYTALAALLGILTSIECTAFV